MAGPWSARREPGVADTIFALSTPWGRSAVAVVRVSGPLTGHAIRGLTGRTIAPRQATFCRLRSPETGELLDEGLVLWFPAPASFTGEDCGEFQTHGSLATVRALLRALAGLPGLREAEPGEFTQRAFRNGKIDLARTEALADLIEAQTDRQRRLALRAAADGGGPSALAESWRTGSLDALAAIDAELDFSDEGDVSAADRAGLVRRLRRLAGSVRDAVAAGERARRVREGFVVAICGPPNSGKSTLLNALAGREHAIVSPHAGTTRDTIEVALDLGGMLVTLCDTAGIRDASDPVERIGVSRARDAARRADLTLWLQAPDDPTGPDNDIRVDLRLFSKGDILPTQGEELQVSALTGRNLEHLTAILAERAAAASDDGGDAVTLRERHLIVARSLADDLDAAAGYVGSDHLELAAAHLRGVLAQVERLGSKSAEEDVLDRIFGRFCIGK